MTIPTSIFRARWTVNGFTMIEIALCLAIIGFALVAIIGVLPTGLNAQRQNREETIVAHDADVWMDAIRNGAQAYDDLTNYVVSITNFWTSYDSSTGLRTATNVDGYDYTGSVITSQPGAGVNFPLINGARIIGLLSTPKYTPLPSPATGFYSNYFVAYVRAMSGAAVEKAPQDMTVRNEMAFDYRMIVENTPYVPFDTNLIRSTLLGVNDPFNPKLPDIDVLTNSEPTGLTAAQRQAYWDSVRLNRRLLGQTYGNSRDLRLTFRWPVLPNGDIGNSRQTFRSFTGGSMLSGQGDYLQPNSGPIIWFFQPPVYAQPRIYPP
jgi:type II secretory pathway pseudopilin PulG